MEGSHYDWVIKQNEGCPADVILLDYSKAFDSVVHAKLFIELSAYGIYGALLLWIENFLTDKKHCVLIDGAVSDYCSVLSGVPQGTVLGPVLFISYVNDLPLVVKKRIKTKLFAYDAKIYDEIEFLSDCLCIQESLNSVSHWSDIWQLALNIPKCIVFHLGKNNPQFTYRVKGVPIRSENTAIDLGVIVSKDLTYREHINKIVADCCQRLLITKKCFNYNNAEIIKQIYTLCVRPILEYGTILWNPHRQHEIEVLENVQEKFFNLVHNDSVLSDLPSLERKRHNQALLFFSVIL